ncbi:MAG: hypothetical protein KBS81_02665 [Spirochaetales bacterium]|nr:hypothetical protein [Candidatus Physcosoma equi]
MNNDRAIYAGERALSSLKEARRLLQSASNWGLFDLFGGGSLSGFLKHHKMNQARNILENARRDLYEFRSELSYLPAVDINIDGFLTFADFSFDGFLADVMVQSRINKAKDQLDDAIYKVESVLRDLRRN